MNNQQSPQSSKEEISDFVKKIKDGTIPVVVNERPTGNKYHRYGSLKKFDKLVASNKVSDRVKAAQMGYGIDKLADDTNPMVQQAVIDYLKQKE